MQDFYKVQKENTKEFDILEIVDGELNVKNKGKSLRRTINIATTLKVSTMVSQGESQRNTGKECGINRSAISRLVNTSLLELVLACEKDEKVFDYVKNNSEISSFEQIKNLYNHAKYFSQRRDANNSEKVVINEADKKLFVNLKCPKFHHKTFKQVEESFSKRTGKIDRVIKSCNYFNKGFNMLEISNMKDINVSVPTVRLDILKRISELFKIYDNDQYIRLVLKEKCGIQSKEQLEELKINTENNILIWKNKKSDNARSKELERIISEMADIIINEFEKHNKVISIQKATDIINEIYNTKMTINTTSYYLKSVLPNFISKDKHEKVIQIWDGKYMTNSYDSKIEEKLSV